MAHLTGELLIGGQRRLGTHGEIKGVNPATGETIADVADLTAEDTRKAIDIAYEAQKEWRRKTAKERCAILLKWNDLMLENQEDLGRILTAEMGKPLAEAKGEIAYGASFIQWFAEEARRVYGDVIPGHQADKRIVVIKQPVGVVASITPWNFPFNQAIRKMVSAIGAGCTLILKGPEDSPSAVVALAQLFHDAGLPPGVLNIVWGVPGEISTYLIESPIVRKISFTGSVPVGKQLAWLILACRSRPCRSGVRRRRLARDTSKHGAVRVPHPR